MKQGFQGLSVVRRLYDLHITSYMNFHDLPPLYASRATHFCLTSLKHHLPFFYRSISIYRTQSVVQTGKNKHNGKTYRSVLCDHPLYAGH
ncbi:hypothetical protein IG631_05949 [Alternaria alternata]|nr:hypothetical protein IG631_05949 [Alternaria alternata]